MDIKKIFENNKQRIIEKLKIDPNHFKKLAKTQNPDILCISCSDSRVPIEDLMGAKPGEVFIHRNIANMVPNTDLNVMSVINFSVVHLKVKHIIVCGHYECGGVKAAMQAKDLGLLNPWLRNIRDVYRLHKKELDLIKNEDDKYKRLIELNVQEQCVNILKTSDVQLAYRDRELTVHGWVFDIHSGELIDLNIDFDKMLQEIMEIYRLS
ncbi:carbonic anhydrase [Lutibacter sp.]